MDDHELLCRYSEEGSEDAFRELVERHGGLVFSVAMRQLQRSHQAQEVTQAVFVALARKAGTLRAGTVLPGWLFRATRYAAAKLQRDEERRQRREREAAMVMDAESASDSERIWEKITPLLNDALASLNDNERGAILLRFFEGHSFREVAESLGTSEDAAKMRVSRALEKLRRRFFKRGVALSVTALAAVFSGRAAAATTALPADLVASLSKSAVAKGVSSSLAQAVTRKLAWWKWKPFVVGVSVIVITGCVGLALLRATNSATANPAAPPAWPPPR